MTDFAAAQRRILDRRAAREASQAAAQQASHAARAQNLSHLRLPPALRVLAEQCLTAWDTLSSPYGTRPAFRVGQVDAELLDEELLSLLKGQAGEGLKLFGGHLKDEWGAEILLGLRAVLWKLSIWDHGASYGASLQGLKYIDARGGKRAEARNWQKAAYGALTVFGRYGWTRWEDWLSERENGYDEPSTLVQRLSRATNLLGTTHSIAAFASFLVFLYNGKYRTLADRLLRLRLVPASNQTSREVSFEYLNRQLVWHAFTEFLLFLLPLVGISRWRRWIARAWKKSKTLFVRASEEDDDVPKGELAFLPERTCAICYADQNPTGGQSEQDILAASSGSGGVIGSAATDVTNPYETIPCGCVYCFVCLAQRIEAEEGEGWTCLRCGEVVKECRPWSGDVVENKRSESERRSSQRSSGGSASRPASRKSVAFADEEEEEAELLERKMSHVDPMPVEDEELAEAEADEGVDLSMDQSGEWARVEEVEDEEDEELPDAR